MTTTTIDIDTPHGPARAHIHPADEPHAALVLGHGAGGGVAAPDLVVTTAVAREQGVSVALVEQPYRVAGRRSAAPAHQLDAAWSAVLGHLVNGPFAGLPVVTGGRSSGARVGCRTAAATGSVGVLCLAFPLQPPARAGKAPSSSRLGELEQVTVPMLIVQGERDRFGMPVAAPGRTVVEVAGDHGLKKDLDKVGKLVGQWLAGLLEHANPIRA